MDGRIDTYLQFLLLGLGAGAIYAALALGLLLTYRSSGVVNFAHGAIAMYAAYAFTALRVDGDLFLPLPGALGRLHVGTPPTVVAAIVAVAMTMLLELVFYVLVFRPLRTAPALSRLVASVGLMVALQAVVTLQYGADALVVPRVLPDAPLHLAGITLPEDRLWLAGIVVLAAAVVWAVYRYTRFGIASRASAEDERALALTGWSPTRVAAANWALAGALAAGAGVLVAPITTADPVTFTLLVVPALAAAMLGRFTSFAVTTVAALLLGMASSVLLKVQTSVTWLPATGVGKALPLVVIVVAAVARGSLVPPRGEVVERRVPVVSRGSAHPAASAAALVAAVAAVLLLHGGERLALVNSLIAALVCLSLVVVTGYLGQLSLAQMAFAGIAGFALARLQHDLGVPFPVDAVVAALAATAVGVLVGLPALRVRGPSLAVATLAAALALEALVFQNASVTGGFAGSAVRPPSIGADLGPGPGGSGYPRWQFATLVVAIVAAAAVAVSALRRNSVGRHLLAVRANERAAAASGISVARTKLLGFAVSAFLAGLAGVLVGWEQGRLSFGSFDVFVSLGLVAVAYVGGIGRVSGAFVGGALAAGGIVFTFLDRTVGWGRYQLLITSLAVVVATVAAPDGLVGGVDRLRRRGLRRRGVGQLDPR